MVAGLTLVLGLLLGGAGGIYLEQAHPDWLPLIAQTGSRGGIDQAALAQAIHTIETQYYSANPNYSKLSDTTIAGLVAGLNDPFSAYLSPAQFKSAQQSYAGRYAGIGVYISFRGEYPTITGLIHGAPAE